MKKIPKKEFKFKFSRSSGVGGQNVNKVNTRVTLFWDIFASKSCLVGVRQRFISKYKRYLQNDLVVIHSQKYRSQARNIEDCIQKLYKFLDSVAEAPKKRKKTKPSKASVIKRLDSKNKHSQKKRTRSEKF